MLNLYYILVIIMSTVLYRWPRGGGLGEGMTTIARLLWAVPTALGFTAITGDWWTMLAALTLWAGIAPKWSLWWPNRPDGGDHFKLNLRGCLLLNPIMGNIYFECYSMRLDIKKKLKLEWTELAELISGFVTALMYALVVAAIY